MATMPDLKQNYPEYSELIKEIDTKISDSISNIPQSPIPIEIYTLTTEGGYLVSPLNPEQIAEKIRAGIDVKMIQIDGPSFISEVRSFSFGENELGVSTFTSIGNVVGGKLYIYVLTIGGDKVPGTRAVVTTYTISV